MPSRRVVEALIRLMGAKQQSGAANKAAAGTIPRTVEEQSILANKNFADDSLVDARQQAREAQGVDPLASPIREFDPEGGGQLPLIARDTRGNPTRLPDPSNQSFERQRQIVGQRGQQHAEEVDASKRFNDVPLPPEAQGGPTVTQSGLQDIDRKLNLLSDTITGQAEKAGTEGVNPNLIRMMEELEAGSGRDLMQRLRNQEFNPINDNFDDIPF